MNTDPEAVRAVLEGGQFDPLIGLVEDDVFEAKAQPYVLQTPMQKFELGKDVAALANAEGGVIVLGLRTETVPTALGDIVREVRPFDQSLFSAAQYQSILDNWLYPPPKVEITWHASTDDLSRGLGARWVAKQPEATAPVVLVQVALDAASSRTTTVLCGVAERRLGRVVQLSAQEVHTLIRDGRSRRELREINEGIRALRTAQQAVDAAAYRQTTLERTIARLDELAQAAQLGGAPIYGLAVISETPTVIPSLFADRRNPLVELLRSPPVLRQGGFRIYSPGEPEMRAGQSRRAVGPGAGLELWEDGTLVYVTHGDAGYLCWSSPKGSPPRINPLTLIETSLLFLMMARQIYEDASPPPTGYLSRICLRSLRAPAVVHLSPGGIGLYEDSFAARPAPDNDQDFAVKSKHPIKPAAAAYSLVKKVYNWFCLEDAAIPYTTTDAAGRRAINPKEIKDLEGKPRW